MMRGFETAYGELTLVLFTTLAPSAILAFILIGVYLMVAELDPADRQRLNRALVAPLIVALVGLIASATHLGNPANALYVFMGVGRSPLSTEVFSAVIFLMLAGVYWLYSFSLHPHIRLQKVWLCLIGIAGVVFITAIAFAYNTETIISWNTCFVPLNLWLNAIVGGPMLALLTFQIAQASDLGGAVYGKVLCGASGAALLLNVVSMVLQNAALPSIGNSFITAAELIPFYPIVIGIYAALAAVGIGLFAIPILKGRQPKLSRGILSCSLVFIGIFLTRFVFYMMHMTVGLAV